MAGSVVYEDRYGLVRTTMQGDLDGQMGMRLISEAASLARERGTQKFLVDIAKARIDSEKGDVSTFVDLMPSVGDRLSDRIPLSIRQISRAIGRRT